MAIAAASWSVADVVAWAVQNDLNCGSVLEEQDIDGGALIELTSEEIKAELKLNLGTRKGLERAIRELKGESKKRQYDVDGEQPAAGSPKKNAGKRLSAPFSEEKVDPQHGALQQLAARASPIWEKHHDTSHGTPYCWNRATGESRWTDPESVPAEEEEATPPQASSALAPAPTGARPAATRGQCGALRKAPRATMEMSNPREPLASRSRRARTPSARRRSGICGQMATRVIRGSCPRRRTRSGRSWQQPRMTTGLPLLDRSQPMTVRGTLVWPRTQPRPARALLQLSHPRGMNLQLLALFTTPSISGLSRTSASG